MHSNNKNNITTTITHHIKYTHVRTDTTSLLVARFLRQTKRKYRQAKRPNKQPQQSKYSSTQKGKGAESSARVSNRMAESTTFFYARKQLC